MKNKFRNLILACLCLGVFVAGGIFYYSHFVVQKPFGIILFLVPELTPQVLTAARIYGGSAGGALQIESGGQLGLLRNASSDGTAPDEASAVSALATGQRINNGQLSIAPTGEILATITQLAKEKGRAVGYVTNGKLLSPSLGAFFAPGADPSNTDQLGVSMLENARPELLLGGGRREMIPELQYGSRKDGRDLLLEARQGGYDIVRDLSELRNTPTWRAPRILGVFSDAEMSETRESSQSSNEPTLSEMVSAAIQLLQFQRQGYVLVVDCRLLQSAAMQNRGEALLRELLAVDSAVSAAQKYAGTSSLVVVAGTLSHGGFQMNGTASAQDSKMGVIGISAEGVPAITWATGPGDRDAATEGFLEPSAVVLEKPVPVATDVLCFTFGEKPANLQGIFPSTRIFDVLNENL